MDYNQKLLHCQEHSLAEKFIPDSKSIQEPDKILERIGTQFAVDPEMLEKQSIAQNG